VPSILPWSSAPSACQQQRQVRAKKRAEKASVVDTTAIDDHQTSCVGAEIEIICDTQQTVETVTECTRQTEFLHKCTQTDKLSLTFSACKFANDSAAIHYYTGLENYEKFQFVLSTLLPTAHYLKYRWRRCSDLSTEDQFFLTCIKLRQHTANFELSRLFGISEFSVGNIFVTWVNFLDKQWHELDIWPNGDLVRYFMPSDFGRKFPSTRVILDGMECPIKKPACPLAQQTTFSTYKNRNTLKVVVGSSPGGVISHIPESYGGSASDRQLVERSGLTKKCEAGDSIMADRGFNVQDMFATRDITVNIPTFMKNKNQLSAMTVVKDKKIASKRIHIERLIGLAKTYKILQEPMNTTETALGSEIIFICCMLCNFRTCIVPRNA